LAIIISSSVGTTITFTFESSEEQALRMAAEYEGNYSEPMAKEFAAEGESDIDMAITASDLSSEMKKMLQEESSWANQLAEDFDLPRAIVYSEILKRKDFV